ncbi:7 transmembrane receptor [Trichostrongylus colubriformis]|uniref:7 transmembrane receptor n=1 Tax=Trichostrongylus colubriformis TaxID=6319 RepID=A0AAN8EUW8_TRICO
MTYNGDPLNRTAVSVLFDANAVDVSSKGNPPEPIFSDYLEMTSLVLMFIIGAPLNLAAYTQLAERPMTSRLDLLKRHLNYTDLLVIFIYVPSRACWLLTYDWRGGDLLCRVVKMMHTVAFQSSSNVIVCIALDRLLSVFSATRHSPDKANRRIRLMLAAAWTTAFIIGLPQLAVWRSYVPFQHINWSQCLQIWEIARLENPSFKGRLFDAESWYSIAHIGLIFWIPALIVVICYVIVLTWVFVNSRPSISRGGNRNGSLQTGCETVDTVLTRTSEWNPLKTFTLPKMKDGKDEKCLVPPRIVVSDESSLPLTTRPSIASSEASAVIRTSVHNSQSYHASVNRSRAVRVSFLLVVAYIICWLPYNLLSLVHLIDKELFSNSFNKFYFLHEFMVFNSVVNPYLYGLFSHSDKIRRRIHE